ncbi:uncharacterized protein NMK_2401 [Novimethylophilus kurashikiensis]|uniref:Uncharacterized protein n=1 Tax=Novimethylophilus kurashikiensis TaxID=1825523 RepID=A0A2R5F989_9PROT|nr:uncharacterized protein NMK_2401 [Novimethylophilus kurashikiensis]
MHRTRLMRRIISFPESVYNALCTHCSTQELYKSEVVRVAVADLARQPEGAEVHHPRRWSQSYQGTRRRRLAMVLSAEFDMEMRRAAVRYRRSVNAFYTLAVESWLLRQQYGLEAQQTLLAA